MLVMAADDNEAARTKDRCACGRGGVDISDAGGMIGCVLRESPEARSFFSFVVC